MIKKVLMCLTLYVLIIMPSNIYALGNNDIITNSNGVEMTVEEYNNLRKLFSEAYIDTMTRDEFEEKMSMGIDFDNVHYDKKYIKTDYNHLTGETTSTEISELEYMMAGTNPNSILPQATYIETAYKWIFLGYAPVGNNTVYMTFIGHWKIMPATRSFDVIAARFVNMYVINGTQEGKQIYTINNGNYNYVSYSFNGTNISNQSNGFGISMNLLNDPDLTFLELEIDASVHAEDFPATIFASYQHAVSTTTLSESQNYTLTSIGLGSVIHFLNNSTMAKYDGMQGTYITFTS